MHEGRKREQGKRKKLVPSLFVKVKLFISTCLPIKTLWIQLLYSDEKHRFKNGRTQQVGLHHKPTDWREWCGLNEWPPTWHRAALSPAGTGRAPPLLNLCHQHKHLALASSHAVTLHSKEVSKHSEHKGTKRGLNQPYLHLPNGGRDVLCCLSIG